MTAASSLCRAGVGVGGDDLLIGPPGHDYGDVLVGREHGFEAGALSGGQQREAGAQETAYSVERIIRAAPMR